MNLIKYCNRIIEYSFYLLFLLVPIVFSQFTSELFEFNKMWLTFGLTITIGAAWIIKMIAEKKFLLRRTFFDLPILLFFISQLISTLISLDQHVSWWGYYSRFNGGFLSTLCYIILYYAFLTNLSFKHFRNSIYISLITGIFVALWGLPAHFGKDPTCLLFRGTFDVTCWTEAFKPTVRIFSTLGQPAWMAAYLAFLIPLSAAFFLGNSNTIHNSEGNSSISLKFPFISQKASYFAWILVAFLFYLDLIFTNTRAGFLAFLAGNAIFWGSLLLSSDLIGVRKVFTMKIWIKYLLILNSSFLILNFLFGFPVPNMEKFTLQGLTTNKTQQVAVTTQATPTPTQSSDATAPAPTTSGSNITDSGKIRQIVWKGAIDSWKKNRLFGTGVETFAFAYYKSRPSEHNLTSEWDYLYNKAHNEYLNYLTTTGILGLGSYLLLIAYTFYFALILLKDRSTDLKSNKKLFILAFSLFSGWVTILISNFLGFSVVIMNIFFFMTPAFLLLIYSQINPENKYLKSQNNTKGPIYLDAFQWTGIIIVTLLGLYLLLGLLTFWQADKKYALGYNLNRVGEYQNAYKNLSEAVTLRPGEPIFKDELALNLATIATALSLQNGDPTTATQAAQQAIALSNETTQNYPNNIVFWKNRAKIFMLLSQSSIPDKETFNNLALQSLEKVQSLAPTDAKVMYNLGLLLKTKNTAEAIRILEEAVKQKPDYTDAYRDLGKTYLEVAREQTNPALKEALLNKAKAALQVVVEQNPNDREAKDLLKKL